MLARAPSSVVLLASMSSHTCSSCGAELIAGGRFCRRCGQPSSTFERGSITEAETRVFEQTAERGQQTQYYDQRPTGPSYIAPNDPSHPNPAAVHDLATPRVKRHGILWGSAIVVVLLLLFGIVLAVRFSQTPSTPAPATQIEIPPPPVAPEPPRPPSVQQGGNSALVYPGAEVIMEMTRGEEGGVRQLRTSDTFEKVVDWYEGKLNPARVIRKGASAILTGDKITAVIKGSEGETTILLTEGIDQ